MLRIQSASIYPHCYVSDCTGACFNSLSASAHFRSCKKGVKARGKLNSSDTHTRAHTHTAFQRGKREFFPRNKRIDKRVGMHLQKEQCCLSSLTVEQKPLWKIDGVCIFSVMCNLFRPSILPSCPSKTLLWVNAPVPAVIHKSKVQNKKAFFFPEGLLWNLTKIIKRYFVKKFQNVHSMNSKRERTTSVALQQSFSPDLKWKKKKLKSWDERGGKLFRLNLLLLSSLLPLSDTSVECMCVCAHVFCVLKLCRQCAHERATALSHVDVWKWCCDLRTTGWPARSGETVGHLLRAETSQPGCKSVHQRETRRGPSEATWSCHLRAGGDGPLVSHSQGNEQNVLQTRWNDWSRKRLLSCFERWKLDGISDAYLYIYI